MSGMTSPESPSHSAEPTEAVYELREAAVEHGRALAENEKTATFEARDRLLDTTLALEEKTAAALDECAESSVEAARDARAEARSD
jgi:hypothetical protein